MPKKFLKITTTQPYKKMIKAIKKRVYKAQYDALKVVNKELVKMYWDIGKIIAERQEKEKWGNAVVENVAKDLQVEFENTRGFSRRNMFNIRNFYLTYRGNKKVQPLAAQIGWTHNVVIMERCKDALEREFYIRMTIREGWSRRILIDKIKGSEYKKWAISQDNFAKTLKVDVATRASGVFKDDYNFDYLMLGEEYTERQLEDALTQNVIKFLAEMGGDFAFVGRQYKITLEDDVEDKEFSIDLLFYHRRLQCLIPIDLKVGEFKPEYAGKMAMYLAALDEYKKLPHENPAIGLLICQRKHRKLADLSLRYITRPIGVGTYKTQSREELPKKISKYMPSEEEIKRRLVVIP